MDTQRPASWRHNVGGFIKAHPGWRISADAIHYTARQKTAGRLTGPALRARTLDQLAALIEAEPS